MEKGIVEWMDDQGQRRQRTISRLVVRWPDGTLSGPVPFDGEMMLGNSSEDMAWIFQPLKIPGQFDRIAAWVVAAIVGAAVYRNLAFFWR